MGDEMRRDKRATGRLIFDSLEPHMPEPLQDVSKDVKSHWDYEEAQMKALFHTQNKELADMPEGIGMKDVNCSVVRASSTDADWETTCVFGSQAGIGYGAHCAATQEAWPTYALWSGSSPEDNYIEQRVFDAMYPKADGRV